MTVEGVLYALLPLGLVLSWTVTAILTNGAWHQPRILALTLMSSFSGLISVTITLYVLAVANAALGYPVSKEAAQIALRVPLLLFIVLQLVFLWAYRTRRFRDES